MTNKEGFEVRIDPKAISDTPEAKAFKKNSIEQFLTELKDKKPFDSGDLVTTINGPYAHTGLLVVRKKENGMVEIAPAPNAPIVEIHESELFHFDDYHEAFKFALVEEQVFNPDKPQ